MEPKTTERVEAHECHECGSAFEINAAGVAEHLTEEGERDFDADMDHVPLDTDSQ
jgi:hypothetical protein